MKNVGKEAEKLDLRDWQLLRELDLDARRPLSSLAKKLRLSKEGIAYRVKRLVEKGVIRGFNAIVDISTLGYFGGGFMVKFQHCTREKEQEIIDYFKPKESVWWLNSRGGEYNLGVAIWAKNTHEFYMFQEEFLEEYRGNMMKTKPRIYHKMYQFPRTYLGKKRVQREEKPKILWNGIPQKYDKIDFSILKLISTNARLSHVEIARRLKLTPAIVSYRIKKMEEKGIILGYRAVLDLDKIGYYWYKVDFYINDFKRKKELLAFASAHPNIIYAYDAIGAADFEIELEVRGTDELLGVIDEIRSRFSDLIINYEYYLWSREHKLLYMPKA